ncbi:MAG: AI-2E family transporter [Polyangiaceae bacterium]
MYLLERHEIDEWFEEVGHLAAGTLIRWFGYVGDSIAVTIRLQVVVAVFNALFTLPVLFFLGLPHPMSLFAVLLVTGLMPVVGSFISGAVLCSVAYAASGPWAVGVFLGVTAILHKIESYVLTPRLASQHVSLPALLMVVSLLLFEEALGFVGLFLSFPALYVATRIRNEWRDQRESATQSDHDAPASNSGHGRAQGPLDLADPEAPPAAAIELATTTTQESPHEEGHPAEATT